MRCVSYHVAHLAAAGDSELEAAAAAAGPAAEEEVDGEMAEAAIEMAGTAAMAAYRAREDAMSLSMVGRCELKA